MYPNEYDFHTTFNSLLAGNGLSSNITKYVSNVIVLTS